jgi:hypothetical protein
MPKVVLVVGVPGSGKSWACRQAGDGYAYVPQDAVFRKGATAHLDTLDRTARRSKKPVLSEVPFGETRLRSELEARGIEVKTVFVVERPEVVASRYRQREGRDVAQGVLTRASKLRDKAHEWGAFAGTSDEVLEHLKRR